VAIVQEPGGLDALDDAGLAAWNEATEHIFARVTSDSDEHPYLLPVPDDRTREVTGPDWTGLPPRVVNCLTRRGALALLDWSARCGAEGRRRLQEEYIEWRVVRDEHGVIERIELTTELRDYWAVIAAHAPKELLELVSGFVGRAVQPEEVYGNRGALELGPEQRARGFGETMLDRERTSPLNNGREGICFMVHPSNDLDALLRIAAAAASPCVLEDEVTGRRRCATACEAIPLLDESAVEGRASDPVIVERLGRLAFERRLTSFDDPLGIYIQGVEQTRLRTPDGAPVPVEWFTFSRGLSGAEAPDHRPRHQRLVVAVPPEHGFPLGELVDAATEQRIRYGGQIADLVQLRLLLRTSEPDLVESELRLDPHCDVPRGDLCADVREAYTEFERYR
jgi:hypothetical protein